MRTPRQWWLRWRMVRKNRRESDAISKRQHEEARLRYRKETLKKHVNDISKDLEAIGFKTNQRYATGDNYDQATFIAVGQDFATYKVIVYQAGGYDMRKT